MGHGGQLARQSVGSGSGVTADFNTLNITADTTVNLDSARTIGSLVFGDTDTFVGRWLDADEQRAPDNILTLAGTTPTITVNALGGTKTVTISAVSRRLGGPHQIRHRHADPHRREYLQRHDHGQRRHAANRQRRHIRNTRLRPGEHRQRGHADDQSQQ